MVQEEEEDLPDVAAFRRFSNYEQHAQPIFEQRKNVIYEQHAQPILNRGRRWYMRGCWEDGNKGAERQKREEIYAEFGWFLSEKLRSLACQIQKIKLQICPSSQVKDKNNSGTLLAKAT